MNELFFIEAAKAFFSQMRFLVFLIFPAAIIYSLLRTKMVSRMDARIGNHPLQLSSTLMGLAGHLKSLTKFTGLPIEMKNIQSSLGFIVIASFLPFTPVFAIGSTQGHDPLVTFFSLFVFAVIPIVNFGFAQCFNSYGDENSSVRQFAKSATATLVLLCSYLSTAILIQEFSWAKIIGEQEIMPHGWNLFRWFPINLIGFLILFSATRVVLPAHPGSQSSQNTPLIRLTAENAGVPGLIRNLNWFIQKYIWFSFIVALYFGGGYDAIHGDTAGSLWQVIFSAKVFLLMIFFDFVGVAYSSIRDDQKVRVFWVLLIPISLMMLILSTVVSGLFGGAIELY